MNRLLEVFAWILIIAILLGIGYGMVSCNANLQNDECQRTGFQMNLPAEQIDGICYINICGPLFAEEQFVSKYPHIIQLACKQLESDDGR